jgi:hypothetical protein
MTKRIDWDRVNRAVRKRYSPNQEQPILPRRKQVYPEHDIPPRKAGRDDRTGRPITLPKLKFMEGAE